MIVSDALKSRKSVRQFTSQPISEEIVRDLLEASKRSPSGGNLQPWKVNVLTGEPLAAFIKDVDDKLQSGQVEQPEYDVYPEDLKEPYRTRRRVVGQQLYDLIGVPRSDTAGKYKQLAKNFRFFGAPVGMFFTIDRQMQIGQYVDMGMFMQSIMLLAREKGLHTCAQEAWARWPGTVSKHIEISDSEMLFCGLALGYEDENAVINKLQSEREEFDEFVTLHGF